jgi:hypothetical protein
MAIARTPRGSAWDPAATSVALEFHAVVTEKSAIREGPDLLGWGGFPPKRPRIVPGEKPFAPALVTHCTLAASHISLSTRLPDILFSDQKW